MQGVRRLEHRHMAAAVEHDEAGVGQLRAEDRPQRRRQQPVVRAPDDQCRRLDAVKRRGDIRSEEVAADLPEADRADAPRVAGEEREARRRAVARAGERESDARRACVEKIPAGAISASFATRCGRSAARASATVPPVECPTTAAPLSPSSSSLSASQRAASRSRKPRQPHDLRVVLGLERRDRRLPPRRRCGEAVDEDDRLGVAQRKGRARPA